MKKSKSNGVTYREAAPGTVKDKSGSTVFTCPFCNPTHPISPFQVSPCGTIVDVRAVQATFSSKYDPRIRCAKCGQKGGKMVQRGDAYIHAEECKPGTVFMTEPPAYSTFAKFVYNLKKGSTKAFLEKHLGRAVMSEEVTPQGEKTGVVFGYFFYKAKNQKKE